MHEPCSSDGIAGFDVAVFLGNFSYRSVKRVAYKRLALCVLNTACKKMMEV